MSVLLSAAARRTYDALKGRPGANPRVSDARDAAALQAVTVRIQELIGAYRLNEHRTPGGNSYVFWAEIAPIIETGAFDDLLDRL